MCVCVCFFRPSCQTAAISVSHTGGQAGKARQSFEVLFSPESSIRPEKTCHVVPPFRFQHGGGEGRDVCSYLLPTPQYTLGCSRPVKLRNLFDLAVNSSSYLFLSLLWDRSRPSSCSPILDRAYFIIYPSTSWLVCSAFCQIFFQSPSKSANHSFLHCSKFAISPLTPQHLKPSLCSPPNHLYPFSLLTSLHHPCSPSIQGLQYILEAFVIPSELKTFSSTG